MTADPITIAIEPRRGGYEATIEYGRLTLSSIRPTEQAARAAVLAMYEDALFGCNRSDSRRARARGRQAPYSPLPNADATPSTLH